MTSPALMAALEKTRPSGAPAEPLTSTATVLKRLAVRYRHQELALIDTELDTVLTLHAPMLRHIQGVGTDVASQLLVTVGDNPERVTTEAKFAALVGVAPIPASSGKTTRHRLSRAGDRQANKAIHRVVLVRMRYDNRTRAYVARRRQEGKGTKEIMRCLRRYVTREIYNQVLDPRPAPDAATLRKARATKGLTLQEAADALSVWSTTLSRLERGLSHDSDVHHRYETWLNSQSTAYAQTAHPPVDRVLPT